MNKIYITGAVMLTSFFLANALEQVTVTRGMMRAAPASSVRVKTASSTVSSSMMLFPGAQIPTTGDPAIDAQIKTLTVEMETKIRAINDEYRTKMIALIGNRSVKVYPMNASGTLRAGVAGREGVVVASGTPIRIMQNREGSVEGEANRQNLGDTLVPASNMPMFNRVNTFFRGVFGGN